MDILKIALKIVMWILIIEFGCNFIMQMISYSFYKNAKKMSDVSCTPQFIQITDTLTGYGYNLDKMTNKIILFFGGSNYIAYNSVGRFANEYDVPFIAADYYGTQESKGKMNLSSMQKTAVDMYEWVQKKFPEKDIVIMGHSYGTGIATYLASVKPCKILILAAGYRDISDLYNKMTPVFWGPLKVFISNNICTSQYAQNVSCPVYIIGSESDKTLGVNLQAKLAKCFNNTTLKIYKDISHENYFISKDVTEYVNRIVEGLIL